MAGCCFGNFVYEEGGRSGTCAFQVVDCNEGRDTKRACAGLVFGFLVLTAILTTVLTSAGYNHKNNRLVITNHGHNRGFYIGCAASGYNRNFNLGWSLGVVAG